MKSLARFGLLVTSLSLFAQIPDRPRLGALSEFWIVSAGDVHFYPYWNASILHAKREDAGTRVRYFLINGAVPPCDQPDVRAVEVFLSGKQISDLTNEVDLCSLEPEKIEAAASQSRRKPKLFESSRIAISAQCGSVRKRLQLPEFGIDERKFAKKIRSGKALLGLERRLLQEMFGNPLGPVGDEAVTQRLGWEWSSQLRSGEYDSGFWFCSGGQPPGLLTSSQVTALDITFGSDCDLLKYRNVLAAYQAPAIGLRGHRGRLGGIEGGRILEYEDPVYSPIAVQARIEGEVSLELTVNRKIGSVMSVKVVTGHPLLLDYAVGAARKWRFDSAQELKEIVGVKLQFTLPCAKRPTSQHVNP